MKQRGQKGAALLELAMCIPLMAILIMALVDIGQALWLKQQLQLIAYEGVRYAARLPGLEYNEPKDSLDNFRCELTGRQTECEGTVEHTNLNRRINTLLLQKWNGDDTKGYDAFSSRNCNAKRERGCEIIRRTGFYLDDGRPTVKVEIEYPYTGLFTRFVDPNQNIVVKATSSYLINSNDNTANGE